MYLFMFVSSLRHRVSFCQRVGWLNRLTSPVGCWLGGWQHQWHNQRQSHTPRQPHGVKPSAALSQLWNKHTKLSKVPHVCLTICLSFTFSLTHSLFPTPFSHTLQRYSKYRSQMKSHVLLEVVIVLCKHLPFDPAVSRCCKMGKLRVKINLNFSSISNSHCSVRRTDKQWCVSPHTPTQMECIYHKYHIEIWLSLLWMDRSITVLYHECNPLAGKKIMNVTI